PGDPARAGRGEGTRRPRMALVRHGRHGRQDRVAADARTDQPARAGTADRGAVQQVIVNATWHMLNAKRTFLWAFGIEHSALTPSPARSRPGSVVGGRGLTTGPAVVQHRTAEHMKARSTCSGKVFSGRSVSSSSARH